MKEDTSVLLCVKGLNALRIGGAWQFITSYQSPWDNYSSQELVTASGDIWWQARRGWSHIGIKRCGKIMNVIIAGQRLIQLKSHLC